MNKPSHTDWPTRLLHPIDVTVGPWAWALRAFDREHGRPAAFAADRRTLVVVSPEDDDGRLARCAEDVRTCPVLLVLDEPRFARRLGPEVRRRIECLRRVSVEIVAMRVSEVTELKAGGMLQALSELRQAGAFRHLGLVAADARAAEWIAMHTIARVILLPYSLTDQSARFRALAAAQDYGMACVSGTVLEDGVGVPRDAWRFSLSPHARVLPTLATDPPGQVEVMTEREIDASWEAYRQKHPEPAPWPRSAPPEE